MIDPCLIPPGDSRAAPPAVADDTLHGSADATQQGWRSLVSRSALLIEIPLALSLIAAVLLATIPGLSWD